jgi:hypothetical protein
MKQIAKREREDLQPSDGWARVQQLCDVRAFVRRQVSLVVEQMPGRPTGRVGVQRCRALSQPSAQRSRRHGS